MTPYPTSVSAALGTERKAPPALRLFCFPYAGGSARIFNGWNDRLPEGMEVCPVELPGRGARFGDPLHDHLAPLVEDLLPGILARADAPVALFGYSLGALVAFEAGRLLAQRYQIAPRHLVVCAFRAPHLPRKGIPDHTLPEPQFRARLREYNGTPEAVLADEKLMDIVGPILRADLAVPETYRHQQGARVSWPITAFAGADDPEAPPADVAAWREQTTGRFTLRVLPDDHFFLHSQQDALLAALADVLR
ncbi:thioesterase II family protein [Nonomuraea sediminis]|uniref:thioesterase II family protein n=1 Tax=Nonomuraea sediminis TaxID=2835864 RepID=UPI001BDD8555|nr:alpha/beta fold hydrolase [Nonomuraea sediminis]